MNITSLYPAIVTGNPAPVSAHLEKLGFRMIHSRSGLLEEGLVEQIFENESGQRMDIVSIKNFGADTYCVRVNVDDFDAALKFYADEGYDIYEGPTVLPTSKNVLLRSRLTNLLIMVMQHTAKE